MKLLITVFCIASSIVSLHAEWTLDTITNSSDLTFDGAWQYSKKTGKKVSLPALTKLLLGVKGKHAVTSYKVGPRGIALICKDGKGHRLNIFLDGQATHSIEWSRAKTKQIFKFPAACRVEDGRMCARAAVQDVADGKLLAQPLAIAHEEGASFKLIISGTDGSYSVKLKVSRV